MSFFQKMLTSAANLFRGGAKENSSQSDASARRRAPPRPAPQAGAAGQTGTGGELQPLEELLTAQSYKEQLINLVKTSTTTAAIVQDQSQGEAETAFKQAKGELNLIPQMIEEVPSPWRTLWLTQLVCLLTPEIEEELFPAAQPAEELQERETRRLVYAIFNALDSYTGELNSLLGSARLRISTTRPAEFRETLGFEISGHSQDKKVKAAYFRCRASTASWSLSIRGASGMVEIFLVPGSEVMLLTQAESESRLKVRTRLHHTSRGSWWTMDGLPVNEIDLKVVVRTLLADLVLRSLSSGPAETDIMAQLLNLEGERLTQAVHQLVMEKQNLVQKIVMQQEEIQNRIARDLHDAVISDVMMLKRSLSENKTLDVSEINLVLDRVTSQLREICHDLAPRDLKDWGLQTVLEDMLQRVAERIGADCQLKCESEIPDLPNAVQLHIFRIVQECLNNIEKYSGATRVVIDVDVTPEALRLTVEDNGKGFSADESGPRRTREGGSGMGSIRERAELIRAFYPAQLSVESRPDKGSKIILEIGYAGDSSKS